MCIRDRAKDVRGLFGIAPRFIAETPAVAVDLNATLHNHGPGDQNIMRRRERPVALIGAEISKLRAECVTPDDGITAISRVAEIERVGHFRNEAADQLGICLLYTSP